MTTLRTAAQQALEALEGLYLPLKSVNAAIAALAQQDEPAEPVAWMVYTESGTSAYVTDNPNDLVGAYRALALYTAPPRCPNCASLEAQNTELDRKLAEMERAESVQEPVDVGLLEYRGNSVAFIHQKMTAYRNGIDAAWDAFKAKGLHPDGKTSLADMIAKYTAPPQRQPQTLDEALQQPRAMAQAYENGYKAGAAAERKRIIQFLTEMQRQVGDGHNYYGVAAMRIRERV